MFFTVSIAYDIKKMTTIRLKKKKIEIPKYTKIVVLNNLLLIRYF